VHRLFQSRPPNHALDDAAELAYARALLRPEECAGVDDVEAIVTEAVTTWRRLSGRADVTALLSSGRVMHEVPFSMVVRSGSHPIMLRGTIDCVVEQDDRSVVIVEFKTGRPTPLHQQQLDLYVDAARILYRGARVDGRLVYAD
jgi:ATP-dependent exoDNAse (exonuclease V) beta subunit